MAEQQDWQIPAPQKRHQRHTMLVRSPHHRPKQQDRNSKDQRLEDDPAKAKTVATKPRIDLAYQKGADDAPLGSKIFPETTHRPPVIRTNARPRNARGHSRRAARPVRKPACRWRR